MSGAVSILIESLGPDMFPAVLMCGDIVSRGDGCTVFEAVDPQTTTKLRFTVKTFVKKQDDRL